MNIQKTKYSEVRIGDDIQIKMDGEKAPKIRKIKNIEKLGAFYYILFDTIDEKGNPDITVGMPDIELNRVA